MDRENGAFYFHVTINNAGVYYSDGEGQRSSPSGNPASLAMEASSIAAPGHFSDGFMTNVLPAATARGNIHSGIIAGKLNGQIPAAAAGGGVGDGESGGIRSVETKSSIILKANNELMGGSIEREKVLR